MDNLIVITGGPGSGKTTLIDALSAAGYARTMEAGRAVIKEQLEAGGDALPWDNQLAFAEKMMERDLQAYEAARAQPAVTFFDRGLPDVIGYLQLSGLPVPEHMTKAAQTLRYRQEVFIAPPWREIYVQDTERKQDFAEAQRTYEAMVAAYTALGYALVQLPCARVEERVTFIVERIRG